MSDNLVGQTLGQYEITEVIGKGGMATVYRAYQPRLKRDVAVKVMLSPLAADPTFRERFEREAQAIARLRHPNILSIHDYGETQDKRLYLVMDYVQGGTLQERMATRISPDNAMETAIQVADALDYAHRQGIVHRDIKPSNILLTHDGQPLLADFGLAKPTHSESRLTGGGLMLGTPDYMAPEQIKGASVDGRIDIYALGVIIFEMLTGQHPYAGETSASVIVKHITEPIPPPSKVNPAIHPALDEVVVKATAKAPHERYQRASEMVYALQMARPSSVTMQVDVSELVPPALLEQPEKRRTRSIGRLPTSIAIGAGAVLVAALIAIAVFVALRARQPPALDITPLCSIEQQLTIAIDQRGSSQHQDLLSYYEAANPEIFAHLGSVAQRYRDGKKEKGATYVMGAPGVGKSFVARALTFLPEEQCEIKLGDLFKYETQKLDFEVHIRPDLATLDGETVLSHLPAAAQPNAFTWDGLLTAAGCKKDGATVPLVIVDDLDELHNDTSMLILREVENLISRDSATEDTFVHIVVFGRPESFVPWLKHANRIPPDEVWRFFLQGPIYSTSGDLEFLCRNYYDFKDNSVPTRADIDHFIQLVTDHPSVTYSIRKLATANFVIEQSAAMRGYTAQSLKAALYDNLLERNYQTHGRPEHHQNGYEYALEEIATYYLDRLDAQGFFAVDFSDTVQIIDDSGESIGEVRVRDVLDRSGVALLDPADVMSARYRFDPFWIHTYLVEQRNQRLNQKYERRSCPQ